MMLGGLRARRYPIPYATVNLLADRHPQADLLYTEGRAELTLRIGGVPTVFVAALAVEGAA